MGERRRRTLRRVPLTQAISPSPRSEAVQVLRQVHGGLQGTGLRLARSGSGAWAAVLGQERGLCPTAAQGVGDVAVDSGGRGRAARPARRRPRAGGRRRAGHGVPTRSPRSAPIWSPTEASESRSSASRSCSTSERLPTVTSERKRPGVTSTPRLDVMTSSRPCASSKINHVVLGQHHAAAGQVGPVEVGVHHHDVGHRCRSWAASAKQRPPDGQLCMPGHSRGPTLTMFQARSDGSKGRSARSPLCDVCDHATNLAHLVDHALGWCAAASPASRTPRAARLRRRVRAPGRRAPPGYHPSPLRPPAGGRRSCCAP